MLRLAARAGWVNFPVKDVIEARKMAGVYDLNSVPDGQVGIPYNPLYPRSSNVEPHHALGRVYNLNSVPGGQVRSSWNPVP